MGCQACCSCGELDKEDASLKNLLEFEEISGKSDVVREALLEILSRLRTRTFRIGDPPPNPAPVVHDYEFSSERMHGRPPSSHTTGASRSAYPAYPSRGYSPPEYIASRGPAPYNYEYPKGPGPIYTPDHGYPSGPPRPPHEAPYAPWSYPAGPPPPATGYESRYSTMEIKIPSSAASSVIGVGGSNISEISQMKPSFVPTMVGTNYSYNPVHQIWKKNGICPEGTIPIQRVRGTSNHLSGEFSECKVEVARLEMQKNRLKTKYLGATGTISAWNMNVEINEWSLNYVSVFNDKDSFVEIGWAGFLSAEFCSKAKRLHKILEYQWKVF